MALDTDCNLPTIQKQVLNHCSRLRYTLAVENRSNDASELGSCLMSSILPTDGNDITFVHFLRYSECASMTVQNHVATSAHTFDEDVTSPTPHCRVLPDLCGLQISDQ